MESGGLGRIKKFRIGIPMGGVNVCEVSEGGRMVVVGRGKNANGFSIWSAGSVWKTGDGGRGKKSQCPPHGVHAVPGGPKCGTAVAMAVSSLGASFRGNSWLDGDQTRQ